MRSLLFALFCLVASALFGITSSTQAMANTRGSPTKIESVGIAQTSDGLTNIAKMVQFPGLLGNYTTNDAITGTIMNSASNDPPWASSISTTAENAYSPNTDVDTKNGLNYDNAAAMMKSEQVLASAPFTPVFDRRAKIC